MAACCSLQTEILSPRDVGAEQMIAGNAVGCLTVIRISPCERVEIGIHPVVKLPGGSQCEAQRKNELERSPQLRLRRICHRKTVAIDIHTAHFHSGIVVVDESPYIILPTPIPQRSESIEFQPLPHSLKKGRLNSAVKGIKTCDHISRLIRIQLTIFPRHQTSVFPERGISPEFHIPASPNESPSHFPKNVPFIFHPSGNFIVPRCEPDIAVWQPAVPTPIEIETVSATCPEKHSPFQARSHSPCNVAVHRITDIIVFVPTLI